MNAQTFTMTERNLSKLFEETVLSRAYKDDEYFRKTEKPGTGIGIGGTRSNAYFRGKYGPRKTQSEDSHNHNDHQVHQVHNKEDHLECKGRNKEDGFTLNNTNCESGPRQGQKWDWHPRDKYLKLLFEFFQQSSMHGLKFIAQPRRHLSERIFWAIAFLAATITSIVLINSVWERYNETPVIVTSDSSELEIDTIPFPAVTVCNMNKIPGDVINNIWKRLRQGKGQVSFQDTMTDFQFVKSFCDNTESFAKRYDFAAHRGEVNINYDASLFNDSSALVTHNKTETEAAGSKILPFIFKETTPCDEMILKCIWAGEVTDCRDLFRARLLEYGKCCSFNLLPSPLLYTDKIIPKDAGIFNTSSRWSPKEIKDWTQWNYKKTGFILDEQTKYPRRQVRAGPPYGLSILLDPNVHNYFCSASDSQGFRLSLSSPLEIPEVESFGIGIGLEQEVFINVRPQKKRQCMFGNEMQLDYYHPYAARNCIVECTSKILAKNCSCVPYSLPRTPSMQICSTDPSHSDHECVRTTRRKINKNVRQFCGNCQSLCTEMSFRYKVSSAKLRDSSKIWADQKDKGDNKSQVPSWSSHKMTIVHIYFGKQEFVPLIRGELFGVRDLIANTGNILCLCLGFSVLSAVEILFFFTCRPLLEYFRDRKRRPDSATVTGPGCVPEINSNANVIAHNASSTKLTMPTDRIKMSKRKYGMGLP